MFENKISGSSITHWKPKMTTSESPEKRLDPKEEEGANIFIKNGEPSKNNDDQQITGYLIFTITGAALGSFQFGYCMGVINAPQNHIEDFMNETNFDRTGSSFSEDAITNLWALTAAIFPVGGCLGGFLGGWWATRFGRKGGSLYNIIFGIVASVLMFASKSAGSYEMIIIGRFIIGFHSGLYTGLSPLYLSEISTSSIRGAIGVLHQLAIVTGMLVSQILGFPVLLGTERHWDVLIGLSVVPCTLQGIILYFCPESHHYLFITRGDEKASRKALSLLRGTDKVEDELTEMRTEMESFDEHLSILELLRSHPLRQPVIIAVVMQLSQQFTGMNGVFYYSTDLFEDTGMSEDRAKYTTSAVGGIMVVMTLVTVPLMDRVGRRTLHLLGLTGMTVVSVFITLTLALRDKVEWFDVASIVVMLIYVVFFALGPGSIPWLIVAELFSHDARPAALSISVLVNWVASVIVAYIFPVLQRAIGDFTFVPFTVFLVFFVVFTFFKVPETKGKSFAEISAIFQASESGSDTELVDREDNKRPKEPGQETDSGPFGNGSIAKPKYGSTNEAFPKEIQERF